MKSRKYWIEDESCGVTRKVTNGYEQRMTKYGDYEKGDMTIDGFI